MAASGNTRFLFYEAKVHPKGGTMPGASDPGLGVGCVTFSSPCISSCSGGNDDGISNRRIAFDTS